MAIECGREFTFLQSGHSCNVCGSAVCKKCIKTFGPLLGKHSPNHEHDTWTDTTQCCTDCFGLVEKWLTIKLAASGRTVAGFPHDHGEDGEREAEPWGGAPLTPARATHALNNEMVTRESVAVVGAGAGASAPSDAGAAKHYHVGDRMRELLDPLVDIIIGEKGTRDNAHPNSDTTMLHVEVLPPFHYYDSPQGSVRCSLLYRSLQLPPCYWDSHLLLELKPCRV
jgi:hypothetical protein